MESIKIEVAKGKYASAKEARRDGQLPLVCYSKDIEPEHYTTDYQNFRRAYIKAGKSTIVSLEMDGKEVRDVLVHEVQYAPVSDDMIHVDLMAIKKGQKVTADIPLVFTGDSAAVREQAGIFTSNKDKVSVECLPKDLPHEIEVDISPITDFHISLTVADIKVPSSITILDAPEISIATVSAPRAAEEETPAEESADAPAADAPAEEKKES